MGAARFKKGDVLVPEGAEYPQGAITVDRYEGGNLVAFPTGGGFQLRFPPHAVQKYGFRRVPAELRERPRIQFYKTKFAIDDGPSYPGWTTGEDWNGWATPHFEFKAAMKLAKNSGLLYEKGRNLFRPDPDHPYWENAEIEEEDIWKGEDIETPEGPKHVYPIGAWYWVWDEVN